MARFNVTYEITTEESAADGDAEERGFISEGISLRDAIADVQATRTNQVDGVECVECSATNPADARWVTVYNGMEYLTGARESRSLHLPDNLTGATNRRIARLVGVRV